MWGETKNLASKLQIKKSLGSQESLKAKYIYQIFSMLNSKKIGFISQNKAGKLK